VILHLIVAILVGYILGSIPFGLIIGKLKAGIDIRQQGSGKTGATNLMRVAGTKLGVLTVILDVAKATTAVILATKLVDATGVLAVGSVSLRWQHVAQVSAGLAAVAGHNWPVFAKFRGGRGVTAYFGTLFAIFPPAGIFGAEILAVAALRSRYMSLGSILGSISALCLMIPLTVVYHFPWIYLLYGSIVVSLLIFQHRDNIKRLQQGTERRLW
jgi:glycerol-3-phosphate acyltransferase PlsY